jgi:hypothetical protein
MIDISTIEYNVELITENGTRYILNDALISLEWEEQKNELAQRATIMVANFRIENTYLMSLAKLNCVIQISAKWNGGGNKLLFEGTIWEWQYVSATNKELTLIAYDNLIRLQQSKDFMYFSGGMTTKAIIGDICGTWGIPLDYKWSQSITHEKKVFNGTAISNMIIELLDEVRKKTGKKYVTLFSDGKLQIEDCGINSTMYKFDRPCTESTMHKLTLNELVTRVKVIGKEDGDGRAPVDAIVDGDLRFGVLQEIIRRDSNKTLDAAKAEANELMKERGKPEEIMQIDVPDVPFIRKGNKIEVSAGNLIGFFFVEGVSHKGTNRKMTLTISRAPAEPAFTPAPDNSIGGALQAGDTVVLNGPVFRDSFGNGRGRTFTNYSSAITIVAPLSRPAPYHIGSVGWARPGDITRR